MPFSIEFMPTTATAPPPALQPALQTVVAAKAQQITKDGETWRTGDGAAFRLADNVISLKRLSPGLCSIVFDAAQQTNSYIAMNGSDATPLKMKDSKGETPADLPKALTIESAPELCTRLRVNLRAWNRFVREARADGTLGQDEQPLEPPADPGTEVRLANDTTGVAAHCEKAFGDMNARLGWKRLRTVISQNPQWGVVWRTDTAPDDDPGSVFRDTCWRRPRHHGIAFSTRPLDMFDPAASIGPLKASD
jgi:hypothetical protein